jgi:transposase
MATGARRDSSKEKFWRRLIHGQAGSGLSVRAWCRGREIKEAAFYWWRRELALRDADQAATAFVPVRLTEDSPSKSEPVIEILLTSGPRILLRGSVERSMLAEVLAVLEGPEC